jgi:hypothetical protein
MFFWECYCITLWREWVTLHIPRACLKGFLQDAKTWMLIPQHKSKPTNYVKLTTLVRFHLDTHSWHPKCEWPSYKLGLTSSHGSPSPKSQIWHERLHAYDNTCWRWGWGLDVESWVGQKTRPNSQHKVPQTNGWEKSTASSLSADGFPLMAGSNFQPSYGNLTVISILRQLADGP